jgi:hypothetical protein
LFLAAAAAPIASATAHETQDSGGFRFTVGWGNEPALAGLPNFIDVAVVDASGAPVTDPAASLTADVTFGGEKVVRPLAPGSGPGRLAAALIPTRAGTYAFRVHGTLRGAAVDITSTCSDRTFECVRNPSDIQFPARDPSTGELAARLDRELARSSGRSSSGVPLAIAALALACAALALGGVALARGRGGGRGQGGAGAV